MHHEPAGQQHRGHGENSKRYVYGDNYGYQDSQIELGEVALQRLAVQLQLAQADRRIGELDRDRDHRVVPPAPDNLADSNGYGPRQRVHPGADRGTGEGVREGAEDN